MNRLEIRNLVSYWVDDINQSYFTPTQVNKFIDNAQFEIQKSLVMAGVNHYIKCKVTTSVANQSEYYLPSDFLKLNRLVYETDSNNLNNPPLQFIPLMKQDIISRDSGIPYYYTIIKDRLKIFPSPENSKTIRLYYTYRVTPFTSDVQYPDIPEEFHEYIAVLAAWDCLLKDGRDTSTLLLKKQYYESLMTRMMSERHVDTSRDVFNDDVYSYGIYY